MDNIKKEAEIMIFTLWNKHLTCDGVAYIEMFDMVNNYLNSSHEEADFVYKMGVLSDLLNGFIKERATKKDKDEKEIIFIDALSKLSLGISGGSL